jgi:hypothetical protein
MSHSEVAHYETKLFFDIAHLMETLLGDDARANLAGRLNILNHTADGKTGVRGEDDLESNNLWMYVSPPSGDARVDDVTRQFWFLPRGACWSVMTRPIWRPTWA